MAQRIWFSPAFSAQKKILVFNWRTVVVFSMFRLLCIFIIIIISHFVAKKGFKNSIEEVKAQILKIRIKLPSL